MSAVATPPVPAPAGPRGRALVLGRVESLTHEIVTPEGVPIRFVVATAGDRIAAFLIDGTILVIAQVLVLIAAGLLGLTVSGFLMALGLAAQFLIRNGYFAWFEAGPRGATPGKRRLGLRVVDRYGGSLSTEAVIVRNLTRDVELWMPLLALIAPDSLWPGAPGWVRLLALLWLLVFALLPLFNSLRLRIGDLVAGTMVVEAPKAALLADVGRTPVVKTVPGAPPTLAGAPPPRAHVFTDEQLDIYGIYELQVLEDVLRGPTFGGEGRASREAVAKAIRAKIKWPAERAREPAEPFLRDFYAALRDRLERRMLLGKKKRDKYSK